MPKCTATPDMNNWGASEPLPSLQMDMGSFHKSLEARMRNPVEGRSSLSCCGLYFGSIAYAIRQKIRSYTSYRTRVNSSVSHTYNYWAIIRGEELMA